MRAARREGHDGTVPPNASLLIVENSRGGAHHRWPARNVL